MTKLSSVPTNTKQPRLLNDVKSFLKRADNRIVLLIEKLRFTRNGQIKVLRASDTVFDTSTIDNLLISIREADIRAYYSLVPHIKPPKFIIYHVVMKVYVSLRGLFSMATGPFRSGHE